MWQGYWWAGQAYKELYEYEKAECEFRQLIDMLPDDHRGYEGLINIAQHQQNYQQIIERAKNFQQKFPELWHGHWWLGDVYKTLGRYEMAESYFRSLIENIPNHTAGYQGMINLFWDKQEWQQLNEWTDYLIKESVHAPIHHTPFYKFKALALINLKKFQEAEQFLFESCAKFPHDVELALTITNIYYPQRKRKKIIQLLSDLLIKFPHQKNIAHKLIEAHIANNEPDEALALLQRYQLNDLSIHEQLLMAKVIQIQQGNFECIDELEKLHEQNPHRAQIAMEFAYYLLRHTLESHENSKRRPSYALDVIEKMYQKYPNNRGVINRLIDAYTTLNMTDKAKSIIKDKLSHYQDAQTLKFKSWLAYQEGDLQSAQNYYQKILQQSFYAESLYDIKGKDLIYRSQHDIPTLSYQDVPMFSVEYNEMLRLPHFLNHYRQLGITHFFFVDNNSDDGSFEFLLSQPDCYVFWTDTSYSEAGSGIAWVHALIDKYALPNQWCIHADSDELLVYPHCETNKLPKLIQYLENEQSDMMRSFMLDMYPKDLQAQLSMDGSQNMIDVSPYFYHDYEHRQQIECPYIHTLGGIFYKFEVAPFAFVKTALFKNQPHFRFLSATHHTTPAKVSSVSSAYLHFKMLGDFQAKAKVESERKQHAGGGAMYRKYAQMYDKFINSGTDLSQLDKSVKYQNSQQLVDLNLIQTSCEWESFCQTR